MLPAEQLPPMFVEAVDEYVSGPSLGVSYIATAEAPKWRTWDGGELRTLTKNEPARATGAHVVIATVSNCGICDQCSVGKPTWCRKTLGNRREIFTVGGEPAGNFAATSSFAEMTVVKEVQAVPIDPEVPLTSACLIACGVVTGMGSVFNRANVQPGASSARGCSRSVATVTFTPTRSAACKNAFAR